MKVGIMTYFSKSGGGNYGAILQALALMKAVERLGYECVLIDYRYSSLHQMLMFIPTRIKIRLQRLDDYYIYNMAEAVKSYFKRDENPVADGLEEVFDNFKKDMNSTAPVDRKSIKEINEQIDLFISGSDQVWSCTKVYPDYSFLLDFVSDNRKKGSYAASFGVSKIPDVFKPAYKRLLSQYRFLSVRELNGNAILKDLIGREGRFCLDPTLLFDYGEWKEICAGNIYDNGPDEPYVLAYTVAYSEAVRKTAREVSDNTGLPLKVVTVRTAGNDPETYECPEPSRWIDYIKNASYIVTNSFHAVAFSVNFGRQFIFEVKPGDAAAGTMSRINDLLNVLGINDRVVTSQMNASEKIERLQAPIDYASAAKRLDEERKKSWEYLKDMLDTRSNELADG